MITNSNQIELRHLRYFEALAKEMHFHRAAEKLYISQPALSKQIIQLEDYLGVILIERKKKKLALTEAGKYLYKESTYILNEINRILERTNHIADGEIGNLRIGFVGSAMQTLIPGLVKKMSEANPGITFTFEETDNAEQVSRLVNGAIDIGFIRLEVVPEELVLRPVMEDTFSLVIPCSHPVTKKKFKSLAQFRDESFILFERNYSPAYYHQILSICEEHGFHPRVAHNSVHAGTIFRLVENNLGVSIVPTSLKNGFSLDVRFIELKNIPQRAKLSIAWNTKNRNPALRHLLTFIEAEDLCID